MKPPYGAIPPEGGLGKGHGGVQKLRRETIQPKEGNSEK